MLSLFSFWSGREISYEQDSVFVWMQGYQRPRRLKRNDCVPNVNWYFRSSVIHNLTVILDRFKHGLHFLMAPLMVGCESHVFEHPVRVGAVDDYVSWFCFHSQFSLSLFGSMFQALEIPTRLGFSFPLIFIGINRNESQKNDPRLPKSSS